MSEPAIDLVLPFYGPPERLRETVASVQAQTRTDWRLTVVDDAWPGEAVGPWLDSLGDDRIRYVRNPANLGISGNFRRCLDLATAPYVAFPGGDDLLLPTYVATVLAAAERTGATVVQPGVRVVDDHGRTVHPLGDRVKAGIRARVVGRDRPATGSGSGDVVVLGPALVGSLGLGNWTYFPSLAWRRAETQAVGFRGGLETSLDLQLLLDLAFDGATLAVVPDEAFAYRRHDASYSALSARSLDRFDEEVRVLSSAADHGRSLGWSGAARRARWRPTYRLYALMLLPATQRSERRRLLRLALRR